MRTMYETAKLAQVTSEMKRYNLHFLELVRVDRRGLEDSEPIQERQCYTEEEMRRTSGSLITLSGSGTNRQTEK